MPESPRLRTLERWQGRFSPEKALAAPVFMLADGRDIEFTADDGFPLSGTLFVNPAGTKPAILVSGAIAVSRRHYAGFARAAIAAGAAAVLVYDYRGTGGSQPPRDWSKRLSMRDWAALDLPAAEARLRSAVGPSVPLTAIGQSIGGTAFALSGIADRFCRHAMIACGHGWLGHTDEPVRLFCLLNLLARPAAALLGYAPAWLGAGMALPRAIVDDWGRYTMRRGYLLDTRHVPEAGNLAQVRIPTLAMGFADDRWTTRRAFDALLAALPAAPLTSRWISPRDCGANRIGHLGFFRGRFADTLWKDVIDWLLAPAEATADHS